MRKRSIQKIVRLNIEEAKELKRKAEVSGLTESSLIRLLVIGYEPKPKPDEQFFEAMRELSHIGNNINQLAAKANALGYIDAPMLKREAEKWNKLQLDIERRFLKPEKKDIKWQ